MSNQCAIVRPPGISDLDWGNTSNHLSWAFNFRTLQDQGQRITDGGVPYYFDADQFKIVCVAFDNAASSGTLLSYQTQINALQTSVANLQAQQTALVSGSEVRAPNPEIIEAQAIVFGAVLTAGVLIWGGKRIYNLFMHPPGSGEKE